MEHALHSLTPVMILLLAGIIGAALLKAFRLTPILGFFLAGVAIGPSALEIIPESETLTLLAEIGVVLLLFDIGLHLSFREMWRLRKELFVMGPLQVFLTSSVIFCLCLALGLTWSSSFIIGAGLALSSTAIVMQLMEEKGLSTNSLGQSVTSILVFQDILIVFLLILIPALAGNSEESLGMTMAMALIKAAGALLLVYFVGKFILQPLLSKVVSFAEKELFTATILLIVIATASLTGAAGLSLPLGAFLAGLIISESHFCYMVKAEIQPFRTLLLGLFFISVGMTLDLNFLANNVFTILLIVITLMTIKSVVMIPVAWLMKKTTLVGSKLGLWLSQAGEFGFVLFALAYSEGLLSENLYQILIVTIGITFVLTPVAISFSERFIGQNNSIRSTLPSCHGRVLVVGFGAEGKQIARSLSDSGISYLAVDRDQHRVSIGVEHGFSVTVGNPASPPLYQALSVESAIAVVFALDSDKNLAKYAKQLLHRYPHLKIFANTLHSESINGLQQMGVRAIFDEKGNGESTVTELLMVLQGQDTSTALLSTS